jgi:NAD(P)H-dependent flavin oxidoreductase YrpB (nitropropane dioxygenase family)
MTQLLTWTGATVEANADTAYKKALTKYSAHETVTTNPFTGIAPPVAADASADFMRRISALGA